VRKKDNNEWLNILNDAGRFERMGDGVQKNVDGLVPEQKLARRF
jgi:hypothetical protein